MLLGVHDTHHPLRFGVVATGTFLMFSKTPLHIGRDAGVERTVFALNQVDEIHQVRVPHYALRKSRAESSMPVKQANTTTVFRKKAPDSFDLPSIRSRNGWKKKKYAIIAAESTNTERKIMGAMMLSSCVTSIEPKYPAETSRMIYVVAAPAFRKGLLLISSITQATA